MTNGSTNLRKAAVLLRSLDSDTAALMLAELSPAEAAAVRAAIRDLGVMESDEQEDVAAEFRRNRPVRTKSPARGVELELSSHGLGAESMAWSAAQPELAATTRQRFEFLAHASTEALVSFLSREHAQTVAVVLAHLTPTRAAGVLASLPARLQVEAVIRLSALGEADPDCVLVLERELANWLASRGESRGALAQRRETVANILAAADSKTRRGIVNTLKLQNRALAEQLELRETEREEAIPCSKELARHYESKQELDATEQIRRRLARIEASLPKASGCAESSPAAQPAPTSVPRVRIAFDQLIRLNPRDLMASLGRVDPNVLALALAGSHEELVDRVCEQMPKPAAREFRRRVHQLGPTRLSDIEAAQRVVAQAASEFLTERKMRATAPAAMRA